MINNDLVAQSGMPRLQSWLGPVLAQAAFSLMTSPLWEALSVFDFLVFVSISLRCGGYYIFGLLVRGGSQRMRSEIFGRAADRRTWVSVSDFHNN